jgi:hypothetical protein
MDIAEVTPHQLVKTVGTTGSGSIGSPAPSPISIDSPSPVTIDSPSPVTIDSPSTHHHRSPSTHHHQSPSTLHHRLSSSAIIDSPPSTHINFYLRSSGSPSATLGGFNLTIGTLKFYIDDAGVGQLLHVVKAMTSSVDSASSVTHHHPAKACG